MPITKDYMAQVSRAEHARESKAKRNQLLAEGKTQYSVWIESETDNFETFLQGKSFHGWFWALTKEQGGEMALAQALTEGYKFPKIQSITVLKEAKKSKK